MNSDAGRMPAAASAASAEGVTSATTTPAGIASALTDTVGRSSATAFGASATAVSGIKAIAMDAATPRAMVLVIPVLSSCTYAPATPRSTARAQKEYLYPRERPATMRNKAADKPGVYEFSEKNAQIE